MNKNKKVILILLIVCVNVICAIVGYATAKELNKVRIKNIITESNQDFYLDPGDVITEYTDGSFTIENPITDTYIFQANDLGDWEYVCKNKEELNKIVNTYLSIKNDGYY